MTEEIDAVLDRVERRAGALDRGEDDVRPALRELAAFDLLALGTGPERAGELPDVVSLVEELGARCLATAFSVWAHRMVIDYLAHAPYPDRAADLAALSRAERFGSTGLAPALRELAGFGAVPLVARRDGDGLRVDGPVSWASNLFPGALLVVPVQVGDGRAVVAIDVDAPGVTVHPPPRLLAMNATASSSLTLDDVAVTPERVLTEDLPAFVGACRPRLMLVQSAFCLGLARRSILEARPGLEGVAASLAPHAHEVGVALDAARHALHRVAARPDTAGPKDHAALRHEAARLAGEATRLEAAVVGGAGYVADSPTARRLREAAFLPVQAPTEALLEVLRGAAPPRA
ncbi:acyl-CoA dehydrogenase family protein [Actinomycetospora flava]|uniref:Acyl-CoA dehydrogenase family protein n=1 Tax=Actinomycetospora flava TaxID=3129232 RepID=A0ABU8M447_9PSEU